MTVSLALDLLQRSVLITLLVAAPLLVTALAVGVIVSLVQAITQLQEQTLTFIPKLVALALVFVLTLPWSLAKLTGYLAGILRTLPTLVGG